MGDVESRRSGMVVGREVSQSTRHWLGALAIGVILALWFFKSAHRPLVHPDEGRYAEIAREMLASGDWTTPRLNGLKYFEKPPLQYWATALAYKVFGISEWSARLWPALTGLGCVLATWWTGRRLFGSSAGIFAALLLLASPYFVIASSVNSLDMGVSCFLTLAVYTYLLSRRLQPASAQERWMLMAWIAMALAVLSKGLIGIVLPFATLVAYVLWHRDIAAWRRLRWVFGLAVFALIVVPWFVQVSRENPEFPEFFFVHEHLQRFTTTVHRRTAPYWYFLPIVLFAVAPWAVLGWRSVVDAWRDAPPPGEVSCRRFLLLWSAVVLGFFSLSQSKLPGYILPIVPSLALLGGDALARAASHKNAFWIAIGALVFGVLTFVANEFAELSTLESMQERYETFSYWAEAASVAFIVTAAIGLHWIERIEARRVIVAMLLAFYATTCIGIHGYRELAFSRSGIALADKILRSSSPDAPVYSIGMYDQTVPYYLGRTIVLVNYEDEFALGIRAEPQKVIKDLKNFARQWRQPGPAFAILSPQVYQQLLAEGLQMEDVLAEPRRLLVRKP